MSQPFSIYFLLFFIPQPMRPIPTAAHVTSTVSSTFPLVYVAQSDRLIAMSVGTS